MSATITSSYAAKKDTTAYAWTGAANVSPSTESLNGVEQRRNRASNPLNGQSLSMLTGSRGTLALADGYVRFTINDASAGANAQRLQIGDTRGSNAMFVTPGEVIRLTLELRSSTAQPMSIYVYWFDVNGAFMSLNAYTQTAPTEAVAFTRQEVTVVPPANAVAMMVYAGTGAGPRAIGDTFDVRNLMVGPGNYFDGSTPGKVTPVQEFSTPLAVLSYETARDSSNIYHNILGGGIDVTIRPAQLRSGTLRQLYPDALKLRAAETMFSRAEVFYLDEPEVPGSNMYFAVAGRVTATLDPETRRLWVLAVDFQEVTP